MLFFQSTPNWGHCNLPMVDVEMSVKPENQNLPWYQFLFINYVYTNVFRVEKYRPNLLDQVVAHQEIISTRKTIK